LQKVLTREEQAEGKIVRELLATMTEQEKKIFRAFLKTRGIAAEIKRYRKYD
jgi:hypothetical protein